MNLIQILQLSFYAFLFLWSIGSLVAVFHLLKYGMSRMLVITVLILYFSVSFIIIGGELLYLGTHSTDIIIQYDFNY